MEVGGSGLDPLPPSPTAHTDTTPLHPDSTASTAIPDSTTSNAPPSTASTAPPSPIEILSSDPDTESDDDSPLLSTLLPGHPAAAADPPPSSSASALPLELPEYAIRPLEIKENYGRKDSVYVVHAGEEKAEGTCKSWKMPVKIDDDPKFEYAWMAFRNSKATALKWAAREGAPHCLTDMARRVSAVTQANADKTCANWKPMYQDPQKRAHINTTRVKRRNHIAFTNPAKRREMLDAKKTPHKKAHDAEAQRNKRAAEDKAKVERGPAQVRLRYLY